MLIATSGLIMPLPVLLSIPFNSLWNDLIIYHLTKSPAAVSIGARLASLVSDLSTKEAVDLLGLIATVFMLHRRDFKRGLITASALILLGPYLLQPTTTSQHLIEATPFFSMIAAESLTSLPQRKESRNRRGFMALTICLLLILVYFLPNPITEIAEARESHPESRVMRTLARDVQYYSRDDEIVFSQLTVVPFLAQRRCPPIADIDWVNKQLGLFTSETVRQLVRLYPLKVIIISHRIEAEIADFLGEHGYIRVDRVRDYRVYVKTEGG
jgi:hypothetical protein